MSLQTVVNFHFDVGLQSESNIHHLPIAFSSRIKFSQKVNHHLALNYFPLKSNGFNKVLTNKRGRFFSLFCWKTLLFRRDQVVAHRWSGLTSAFAAFSGSASWTRKLGSKSKKDSFDKKRLILHLLRSEIWKRFKASMILWQRNDFLWSEMFEPIGGARAHEWNSVQSLLAKSANV